MKLGGIDGRAVIAEDDFECALGANGRVGFEVVEIDFKGLINATAITMTNDIGERFINGASDGAAIGGGETQSFREAL